MSYLYESHFHTEEVSSCGEVSAKKACEMYKNAGYSGIVITDHISSHYFKDVYPGRNWKEGVDYFLNGYKLAKECADDDFAVILGMEVRFNTDNDYLVYGLTEDFLYNNEWFTDMDIKKFKTLAEENQLTIVQAHPFRINSTITNPRHIDGIEIYNGNRRHDSSNNIAEIWAKKHGLITTCGSDFHEPEDLARAGMSFENFVKDSREFRAELLARRYELKF